MHIPELEDVYYLKLNRSAGMLKYRKEDEDFAPLDYFNVRGNNLDTAFIQVDANKAIRGCFINGQIVNVYNFKFQDIFVGPPVRFVLEGKDLKLQVLNILHLPEAEIVLNRSGYETPTFRI